MTYSHSSNQENPLYLVWQQKISEGKIESYLEDAANVLVEKKAVTNPEMFRDAFYRIEKEHAFYKDNSLKKLYEKIFTLYRDHVFEPLIISPTFAQKPQN